METKVLTARSYIITQPQHIDNKTKFWFLLCLGPNNYSDTSAYMSEPIKQHASNPHPQNEVQFNT